MKWSFHGFKGAVIYVFILINFPTQATHTNGTRDIQDANEQCGLDNLLVRTNRLPWDLWPNARVPYEFDSTFGDAFRDIFLEAVDDFRKMTCVRWEPKTGQDDGFVFVHATVDNDTYCGSAMPCNQKGNQSLQIRWDCGIKKIIVHEMLHTLCMLHERARTDRDEFLTFPDCPNPPPIEQYQIHSGNLYDYATTMHNPCRGGCEGSPIIPGVPYCGAHDHGTGIGVLDADKINEYYNCQGCHSHRWYPLKKMTTEKWAHLLDFATQTADMSPIYVCRAYGTQGEISPGIFIQSEQICRITPWEGPAHYVREHIELFALPTAGPYPTLSSSGKYQLVRYSGRVRLDENHVGGGRLPHGSRQYIAVATDDRDGEMKTYIGFYIDWYSGAQFSHPVHGDFELKTYSILKCNMD